MKPAPIDWGTPHDASGAPWEPTNPPTPAVAVSAADNAALRAELADLNNALMAESRSAEGLADAQAFLMTEVKGLRERVKVLEDAMRKVIVQNEHDLLLTGEELRAARAALGDNDADPG